MSKKKNKAPIIQLIGNNATEVTGSIILVTTTKGTKILLECGMVQGGSVEEDYRINANALNQLDLNEIKYCFLAHSHSDHVLLTPMAVKHGMDAKIITTPASAKIMTELLRDGAFVNQRNAEYLTTQYKRQIPPLFTPDDVSEMLNRTYEYGFDEIHQLDDEISFKFLRNSHVLGASSIELYIKDESSRVYKIFYSSDLGNTAIPNRPYLSEMEYCRSANCAIFESTYGDRDTQITKHDREKELQMLKKEIVDTCISKKGNVLIPCFSFSRSQEMMTVLFDMLNEDERFNKIDVVVDSRLTKNITNAYTKVLEDEDKERFDEVLAWENLKIISDYNTETTQALADKNPKIVISSSGFCDFGHVKEYVKRYVTHKNNTIIFCGYTSERSLAGKLRKDTNSVTIDKKAYPKKAKIISLESFSSHMQKKQLVDYICSMNTDKVILVHGDKEAKQSLKESVEVKLKQMNKTTNVIVGQKSLKVSL
jgi:metallo-beta-lactamase family protein